MTTASPVCLMTFVHSAIASAIAWSAAPDCPVGAPETRHLGSTSTPVRLSGGLVARDLLTPKGTLLDKKPCLTGT
jgi:hypothetical protein